MVHVGGAKARSQQFCPQEYVCMLETGQDKSTSSDFIAEAAVRNLLSKLLYL